MLGGAPVPGESFVIIVGGVGVGGASLLVIEKRVATAPDSGNSGEDVYCL